jgi:hypothetical protein
MKKEKYNNIKNSDNVNNKNIHNKKMNNTLKLSKDHTVSIELKGFVIN